jgi:Spy/CpxP family protein refolding chaperone
MLKKMILLVALVALVASTQVFAADEPAAPAKPAPAPARERTVPAAPGGGAGMGGGMGRGMGMGGGMGGMVVWGVVPQLTGLTEEQKTQVNDLRTASQEKAMASAPAMMAAQAKVTEVVNAGGADDAIKAAAADYTKLYVEQAIANAATMRKLRTEILKPDQVTELDKLVKERMASFGGRGMGGGQGGQGGGRNRGAGGAGGADGGATPRAPRPAAPAGGTN